MYLYRFDTLKALRSQRRYDPVLRGRRGDGNGDFPHHQIRDAHSRKADGEAVYQLSFWKSFESLRANLWAHQDGWVIQRIPENHAGLHGFDRGDDEYLVKHAWLYWQTLPILAEKPERASIGIPHEDIEVLHPNGEWKKMEEVTILTDKLEDGWSTVWLQTSDGEDPIRLAQRQLPTGEQAVLIRQIYGQGPSIFNRGWRQQGLLEFLVNEGYITGDPRELRWFFALEQDEDIVAEELSPLIRETRTPGMRGAIDRLRGIKSSMQWTVNLPDHSRFIQATEVDQLYKKFGIEEALRRGKHWSYRHLAMTFEERQTIFAE